MSRIFLKGLALGAPIKSKQGDFLADIRAIRGGRVATTDKFRWEKNCVTRPKVDEAFPGAKLENAVGREAAVQNPGQLPTKLSGNIDIKQIRSDLTKEVKNSKLKAKLSREK